MNDYKIINYVQRLQNGYLVNYATDDEDCGNNSSIAYTYDDDKEHCEALVNMFYDILNEVRPNSKHLKYRIKIEFEHNDEL